MWTPGLAALVIHLWRREPPRAMGFAFTGVAPWLAAFFYPLAVVTICIALAYTAQAVTGRALIHYQPDAVRAPVFGIVASGWKLAGLRLLRSFQIMAPWLMTALAYRLRLPERCGRGRHLVRVALWASVYAGYPNPWWLPPGCIGEELGWRGWLVRTWRDRPRLALLLSACAWASFHLPVVALMPPLHHLVPALAFLASVAAGAAAFQALYLWSGSVWPPIIAHFSWNVWNPFFLGDQYGDLPSLFGGQIWLINGEGLLGMLVNGTLTLLLLLRWSHGRPRRA
jgi:membrane protease YdiL (CAAX protease family)